MEGLSSLFYPADDEGSNDGRSSSLLSYYRQREWRISGHLGFTVDGHQSVRPINETERQALLGLDRSFFEREIDDGTKMVRRCDVSSVCVGLKGKSILSMVRRVIVPAADVPVVENLLQAYSHQSKVASLESLN